MNSKKGQAAMEFLMAYGWAIMIFIIAVAALAYFGVIGKNKNTVNSCALSPGIYCKDFVIGNNGIQLLIQNSLGVDMNKVVVSIKDSSYTCSDSTAVDIPNSNTATITVSCPNLNPGTKFKGNILVTYSKATASLSSTSLGSLGGQIGSQTLGGVGVGNIDVNVKDNLGTPVKDANVYLDGISTGLFTDVSGKLLLLNVPIGSHTIDVRKTGYNYPATQTVTVNSGQTSLATFTLTPTTGKATVSITVFGDDSDGNDRISGATIYIDNVVIGTSDANGQLTINNVPSGIRTIKITMTSFDAITQTINVPSSGTLLRSYVLSKPGTGYLDITIFNGNSFPTRLAGVSIYIDGNSFNNQFLGTTNALGFLRIYNILSANGYTLIAKKSGFSDGSTTLDITAGQRTTVSISLYP